MRYRNGKVVSIVAIGAQITAIIGITILMALKMILNSIDKDKGKKGSGDPDISF